MEVCVKQEKFDTEFESETDKVSVPWEVIGSWVTTSSSEGSLKSGAAELIIPLAQGSKRFDNGRYENDLNRAQREFVPDEKKDVSYWNKRIKNNASARRSRLKKKVIEKNMEAKLQELQRENIELKYELAALRRHFADQLESKHEVVPEAGSDMSMRTGSGSDTSDSGSVNSEGESYNTSYETDKNVNLGFNGMGSTSGQHVSQNVFPYNNWTIPLNYSLLQYPGIERGDNSSSTDFGVDLRTKLPHKFRHKKDYHSAFYVHPFPEETN